MNSIFISQPGSKTSLNLIRCPRPLDLPFNTPQSVTRVLVTANRFQLAALLEKGLRLQGWTTCVATTANAVIDIVQHEPIDLVLLDADFFQADTVTLIDAIDQQRSPVIVMAEDYEMSGYDLRDIIAVDRVFIKPFSTHHLISVLKQKHLQPM